MTALYPRRLPSLSGAAIGGALGMTLMALFVTIK